MSYLDKVSKPAVQAPIITIVGFPGAGKTTMGGLFPECIFIQAENSQTVFESWPVGMQPDMLPQLSAPSKKMGKKTSEEVTGIIRELLTTEHKYKTVVIDSISTLNNMFEAEVVEFDANNAESIGASAGGYHNGYSVSASMHSTILRGAEALQRKGIAVIFLCHTGQVKMKNQPDEAKDYSAFSLNMHERSRALYVAKSDAVIYLKQEKFIKGGENDKRGNQIKTARVQQSEDRILITKSDGVIGYIDAKNRYNLPNKIEVNENENPLLELIPFFKNQPKPTQTKPQE